MNFKEIINIESNPFDVFIGTHNKTLGKINLINNPSILITGSTGTSKSVMLNQILLQLINKNDSNNLKIVTINPTKVELKPYRITNYAANKEIPIESSNLQNLIGIMEKRINLFKENSVETYEEYNKLTNIKLPIIVLAIDEATFILKEPNSDEKLRWIINNCKKTGTILLLTTNDLYNPFFKKGYNTLASIRISFDFVSDEDSKLTNLKDCDKLAYNEFLIEINNKPQLKFNTLYFEEETIDEILK